MRTDTPVLDYIALHGIRSWVSDENRDVIVNYIREKLKPGGVYYIDYKTLPGWATFLRLQQLLNEHVGALAAPGVNIFERIDGSL